METYAIARPEMMKVAALLFDKLYYPADAIRRENLPAEVFQDFPSHVPSFRTYYMHEFERASGGENPFELFEKGDFQGFREFVHKSLSYILYDVAQRLRRGGCEVTPVYESVHAFNADMPVGPEVAYRAIIDNLPLADSASLDWRQVLEFRRDADAARKYRSLRNWASFAVSGKTVAEASAHVAKLLDDYSWALQKHGIKAKHGALSAVLDSKSLAVVAGAGGIAAYLHQPEIALVVTAALASAKVALHFAEHRLQAEDLRRGEFAPIAVIHEIRDLVSAGA